MEIDSEITDKIELDYQQLEEDIEKFKDIEFIIQENKQLVEQIELLKCENENLIEGKF